MANACSARGVVVQSIDLILIFNVVIVLYVVPESIILMLNIKMQYHEISS